MPGTARIGPIEITGFDGQITIVSAVAQRLEHARRGPGALGAVEPDRHDRRLGPFADEPLLHRELLGAGRRPRLTVMRVRTRSSVIGSSRSVERPRLA